MKTQMKITIGNRISTNNPIDTVGYDVKIVFGGNEYYYRLRKAYRERITVIKPVTMRCETETTWEKLNIRIRQFLFYDLKPNGTEEDKNLFVYGEKKGTEINEENKWADSHKVYDRKTTIRLGNELGHFEKVEFKSSVKRVNPRKARVLNYLIDEDQYVTITVEENSESEKITYKIRDYSDVLKEKKYIGRKARRIAKKAEVPWKIGLLAAYIPDEKYAIEILKKVKGAIETATLDQEWDLTGGGNPRIKALEEILGKDVFEQLKCESESQARILAYYLLGINPE